MADSEKEKIWANLLHLGFNMWEDREEPSYVDREYNEDRGAKPYLRFDESLWSDQLEAMVKAEMNMVVIDLGEGVRYESHPEIAVKDSWPVDKLRAELARMRKMGLEPIPKLNFATTHDAWLGEYSKCVSSDRYYAVCRDLIKEVSEIFDSPRFFHLGMDEETTQHQRYYAYMVVRQFDLWWHDLYFLCDEVKKAGVRPWIWSDYLWHQPDVFFAKMPKDVLQSNWYYGDDFTDENNMAKAYRELEQHGYDQIPTGSNHSDPRNFGMTVEHCSRIIDPSRLLGYLQAPWRVNMEKTRQRQMDAIDQVAEAKRRLETREG